MDILIIEFIAKCIIHFPKSVTYFFRLFNRCGINGEEEGGGRGGVGGEEGMQKKTKKL